MKETKSKYLEIKLVLNKDYYACINIQQDVIVGYIKRRRLGRFMHWCLEPEIILRQSRVQLGFTFGESISDSMTFLSFNQK